MKMTDYDKEMLSNSKEVTRRGIYEILDKHMNRTGRYALVIIGSHRNSDNYVSIIKLNSTSMDPGNHGDEIGIQIPDGQEFWVHCGMITYISRNRLGERLHYLSKNAMRRINKGIEEELGLINKFGTYKDSIDD